jgi:hypothetical protein
MASLTRLCHEEGFTQTTYRIIVSMHRSKSGLKSTGSMLSFRVWYAIEEGANANSVIPLSHFSFPNHTGQE